jgi:hypothetical protein
LLARSVSWTVAKLLMILSRAACKTKIIIIESTMVIELMLSYRLDMVCVGGHLCHTHRGVVCVGAHLCPTQRQGGMERSGVCVLACHAHAHRR